MAIRGYLVWVSDSSISRIRQFLIKHDGLFKPPLSERLNIESYAKKLSTNAENLFAVYEKADVAHAAVYVNRPERFVYISSVCVAGAWQGMGIADLLMEAIFSLSEIWNCNRILLHVNRQHHRAIAFYEKHGFAKIGRRESDDSLEMECSLD